MHVMHILDASYPAEQKYNCWCSCCSESGGTILTSILHTLPHYTMAVEENPPSQGPSDHQDGPQRGARG